MQWDRAAETIIEVTIPETEASGLETLSAEGGRAMVAVQPSPLASFNRSVGSVRGIQIVPYEVEY
ncbi:MAG: hypothetical protein QOF51_2164 [Chloroflexota bacterium]|jgi:hypothetical protein|nr:hypothetical protein [Chloroflexota bacterium]